MHICREEEGRKEGKEEGSTEMEKRKREVETAEGGKEGWLGVGSPTPPPLLPHAAPSQTSVVAFT